MTLDCTLETDPPMADNVSLGRASVRGPMGDGPPVSVVPVAHELAELSDAVSEAPQLGAEEALLVELSCRGTRTADAMSERWTRTR
jgi:hypothetical protein